MVDRWAPKISSLLLFERYLMQFTDRNLERRFGSIFDHQGWAGNRTSKYKLTIVSCNRLWKIANSIKKMNASWLLNKRFDRLFRQWPKSCCTMGKIKNSIRIFRILFWLILKTSLNALEVSGSHLKNHSSKIFGGRLFDTRLRKSFNLVPAKKFHILAQFVVMWKEVSAFSERNEF